MLRRLWPLVVLGVVASFLAGCGAASFTTGRPASERWLQVVTPHFVVNTDLARPRALSMAQALEDSRAALLASAWPGAEAPRGRTQVMLFAKQRDLSRYAGRNNQGVVFTRAGFERLLAFRAGFVRDEPTVAVHELVHDLSRWFFPLQPLWLAEGLAVYLEGIEVDRERGRVVMGTVSMDSVEWLRHARFIPSTSQLFAARDFGSIAPGDAASFYLGSWVLVRYLLEEQPEGFERFQEALTRLTPWRRAWEQSFPGLTNARLDLELVAYLKSRRFKTSMRRFAVPVFTPEVRVLSAAEVHGARALLANTSGEGIGEVEVAAALALDPNELNALTVRFHSLAAGARGLRADIARRAVKAHPREAGAWLLSALAAADRGGRRAALAQAQRLDPDHPGVAGLLAQDALSRGDPFAALLHVRHAQRRSGVTPRNLALQFAALAASSSCGEASAIVEQAALSLEPECRVAVVAGERQVTCFDYVRRAYAARPSCSSKAL